MKIFQPINITFISHHCHSDLYRIQQFNGCFPLQQKFKKKCESVYKPHLSWKRKLVAFLIIQTVLYMFKYLF